MLDWSSHVIPQKKTSFPLRSPQKNSRDFRVVKDTVAGAWISVAEWPQGLKPREGGFFQNYALEKVVTPLNTSGK